MVLAVVAGHGLGTEDSSTASRTIFSGIFRLDESGVNDLVIHVRGSDLRAEFYSVAFFAVELTVWAIVVGQTVQEARAIHATEAIFVIP